MGPEPCIIKGRSNAHDSGNTSCLASGNAGARVLEHNAFFWFLAQPLHPLNVRIAKGLGAGTFRTNYEVIDDICCFELLLDLFYTKLARWPWRVRYCDSPHTMLFRHRERFAQTSNDWHAKLLCLGTKKCILLLRNLLEFIWPII